MIVERIWTGNSLRNFNYLIMSEDHTTGLGGVQTPRSQVAQNDAAVGQLIAAVSRSKYVSAEMPLTVIEPVPGSVADNLPWDHACAFAPRCPERFGYPVPAE